MQYGQQPAVATPQQLPLTAAAVATPALSGSQATPVAAPLAGSGATAEPLIPGTKLPDMVTGLLSGVTVRPEDMTYLINMVRTDQFGMGQFAQCMWVWKW